MGRSTRLGEHDAYRRCDVENIAGWRQSARSLVDPEHYDAAGILIGGQKKGAGRIDGEVTRRLPLRRYAAGGSQRAAAWVDAKDGDGIISAV